MRTLKTTGVCVLCTAAVFLLAVFLSTRDSSLSPPRQRGARVAAVKCDPCPGTNAVPSAVRPSRPFRFDYAPGQRLEYSVRFSWETEVSTGAAAPCVIQAEGKARMTLAIPQVEQGVALVHARFDEVEFSEVQGERRSTRKVLDPVGGRDECAIYVTPQGEVRSVLVPKEMSAPMRGVVESLLRTLHFRCAQQSLPAWEAEEADAIGTFRGSYHLTAVVPRTNGGTVQRIHRDKEGVTPGGIGATGTTWEGILEADVEEGTANVLLLDCEDRSQLRGDMNVSSHGQVHFALVRTYNDTPSSAQDSLQGMEETTRASQDRLVANEAERALQKEQMRGWTVQGALLELHRLALVDLTSSREADPAFDALVALMATEDSAVEQSMEFLERVSPSDKLASLVLCALGIAGTPRAQQALADVLQGSEASPVWKSTALVGMSQIRRPTPSTEEAVRRFVDQTREKDLALHAIVVLGAIARHEKETDAARADAIRTWLESRYRSTEELEERLAVLGALGNAADPASEPLLLEAVRTGSDPQREIALDALRGLRTQGAEQALAAALHGDPSIEVRFVAMETLAAFGTPGAREALSQAARSDASADVRTAAAQALARLEDSK